MSKTNFELAGRYSLLAGKNKLEKALQTANINTETKYTRLLHDLMEIAIAGRLQPEVEALLEDHIGAIYHVISAFVLSSPRLAKKVEKASRPRE
jgi:hypothetical protein